MSELDLDAIERRANNQRATDEDLLDLVAEVRRLRKSEAISWRIGLDLAKSLTDALGLDHSDPDACVPGCDEPGGLEHDLWHLVQQRDQLAKELEASKAAHAADYAHLDEQAGRLRTAVNTALSEWERHGHDDRCTCIACDMRRALGPTEECGDGQD